MTDPTPDFLLGQMNAKMDTALRGIARIEAAALERDAKMQDRVRALEAHKSRLYGAWVASTAVFGAIVTYIKTGGPS